MPQSMGLQRVDTTERLNEDSNYFHPPPSVTIVYTQQYHSHHVLDSREHRNSSPFLKLESLKLDTRILAISHFPSFLSTWEGTKPLLGTCLGYFPCDYTGLY